MNHPFTVKELEYLCKKEILAGNGNKEVYLSNDDEGNGYHGLYFGFEGNPDVIKSIAIYGVADFEDLDNTVILG